MSRITVDSSSLLSSFLGWDSISTVRHQHTVSLRLSLSLCLLPPDSADFPDFLGGPRIIVGFPFFVQICWSGEADIIIIKLIIGR